MGYEYDFGQLAREYEYVRTFYDEKNEVYDFCQKGLEQLTRAILDHEYGIKITPLENHLCPAIPSRLAYLDHINSTLKETVDNSREKRAIKGLDIGTGAYAIYAILGHAKYGWEMLGTDIDQDSIDNATGIIKENNIDGVQLKKVVKEDHFFSGKFTFTLCNPPFFNSREEMKNNAEFKEKLTRDQVTASDSELVTSDGEVGFVSKMIKESVDCQEQIQWFSSLLGKWSSLTPLVNLLNEQGCDNYTVKSYQLGKTKRWILLWSFGKARPKIYNDYKLITPTVVQFSVSLDKARDVLKDLSLKVVDQKDELMISTNGDVWSRAFKRRKRQKTSDVDDKSVFRITKDSIYWQYGGSSKLFQSFHTYIRKNT